MDLSNLINCHSIEGRADLLKNGKSKEKGKEKEKGMEKGKEMVKEKERVSWKEKKEIEKEKEKERVSWKEKKEMVEETTKEKVRSRRPTGNRARTLPARYRWCGPPSAQPALGRVHGAAADRDGERHPLCDPMVAFRQSLGRGGGDDDFG